MDNKILLNKIFELEQSYINFLADRINHNEKLISSYKLSNSTKKELDILNDACIKAQKIFENEFDNIKKECREELKIYIDQYKLILKDQKSDFQTGYKEFSIQEKRIHKIFLEKLEKAKENFKSSIEEEQNNYDKALEPALEIYNKECRDIVKNWIEKTI